MNEISEHAMKAAEKLGLHQNLWFVQRQDGSGCIELNVIKEILAIEFDSACADKDEVIERYRRALEWYADYDNWRDDGSIRVREKGSRARATLHPEEKRPNE